MHPDRGTPRAAGWKGWSERHRGPMGWPGRPRLPPTPSRRSRGGRGRCIVGDHCSILEFLPVGDSGMALPPRPRSVGSLDTAFGNANFTCGHLRGSAVIRRGVPRTYPLGRPHRRRAEPLPWDGPNASDPVRGKAAWQPAACGAMVPVLARSVTVVLWGGDTAKAQARRLPVSQPPLPPTIKGLMMENPPEPVSRAT